MADLRSDVDSGEQHHTVLSAVSLGVRISFRVLPRDLEFIAANEANRLTSFDLVEIRKALATKLALLQAPAKEVSVVHGAMNHFQSLLDQHGFPRYFLDLECFCGDLVQEALAASSAEAAASAQRLKDSAQEEYSEKMRRTLEEVDKLTRLLEAQKTQNIQKSGNPRTWQERSRTSEMRSRPSPRSLETPIEEEDDEHLGGLELREEDADAREATDNGDDDDADNAALTLLAEKAGPGPEEPALVASGAASGAAAGGQGGQVVLSAT